MPVQLQSVSTNDGEAVSIQMVQPGEQTPQVFPVSLAGQRSVVRHLRLQFNVPVVMSPDSVSITPRPGVNVLSGTLQPNQLPVTASVHPMPGGNGNVWIVTFSGPGTDLVSGVIKQGVYDVTVDPTKVTAGSTQMDPAPTVSFWTMYGGTAATGTIVRSNLEPNLTTNFGASLANPAGPPAYRVDLDRNLDGHIDGIDLSQAGQVANSIWVF